MRASELMIGDWVNFLIDIEGCDTEYDPKNEIYQPMQIVNLTAWGNYDGEVESTEGVINDIDQVKPIPLTAEILEKNGFIQKQSEFINGDIGIIFTIRGFSFWSKKTIEIACGNGSKINNLPCYVHQLQHTLRLCGIEKEIEL